MTTDPYRTQATSGAATSLPGPAATVKTRTHTARVLARLPAAVAIGTGVVAAVAMALRNAWPPPDERVLFAASLVTVAGVLRLPGRSGRLACALAWIALLVWHGLPTSERSIGADFRTFYDGAHLLFARGASPYLAAGTTAFPFPTFALVWLLSLAGRLGPDTTVVAFVVVEVLLLAAAFLMARRAAAGPPVPSDVARDLLLVGLLLHPTVLAGIGVGNSSVVAGVLMVAAVWAWQRDSSRWFPHSGAILVNLAWMVKPQLLMATAFFLAAWLLERYPRATWNLSAASVASSRPRVRSRAAAIGRVIVPWGASLIVVSTLTAPGAMSQAYVDFPWVAAHWHSAIAATYPNNYAPAAVLAKALARLLGVSVLPTLAPLWIGLALLLLTWNVTTLRQGRPDSPQAAYPWLLSSLLWSSLVWEWYLTLAVAALLGLVLTPAVQTDRWRSASALWLAAGIALTMVVSSFAFTVGVVVLYCHSQALRARESAACEEGEL
jgi:hypothetical protein